MKTVLFLVTFISSLGWAQNILSAYSTTKPIPTFRVTRPFAEYERASLLFMSSEFSTNDEIKMMKTAIVKNTPADVVIVIYGKLKDEMDHAITAFKPLRNPEKLKFVLWEKEGSRNFWTRDAFPVAAFGEKDGIPVIGLVGGVYPESFQPNVPVGELLSYPLVRHGESVDHGNFMADTKGNCFVGPAYVAKDTTLGSHYRCKTVTHFPRVRGIGHIDEHSKLLSDDLAITDSVEHQEIFASRGIKTILIPAAGTDASPYRTYANTLVVNGTAFVPIYDNADDSIAISVFESQGLKVIPLLSKYTSDKLHGSIHCFTMIYP